MVIPGPTEPKCFEAYFNLVAQDLANVGPHPGNPGAGGMNVTEYKKNAVCEIPSCWLAQTVLLRLVGCVGDSAEALVP